MKYFTLKKNVRRMLSAFVGVSMLFSCAIISHAADVSDHQESSDFSDLILEDGEEWFPGAIDPNYATTMDAGELTPPPELVIGEGEEWIPGAVDPRLYMPMGDEDECGHYNGPSNYRYLGAVRGNTTADVEAIKLALDFVLLAVPKPFDTIIDITCDSLIDYELEEGDSVQGDYVKYQYIYNVGPDPNMYWYHTFFAFATVHDQPIGETCYATYSPEKPGDPFQD